jgi:DNA-binding GntR family transcriptional regulator
MQRTVTLPIGRAVEGETLADHVLRQILSAIVKGDITPGSKIAEPELARAYGISRGPLREALHRLEGQNLVARVPHVGARVISLSRQELSELYQVRESLEGTVCRLAAERMQPKHVEELRDVLREHEHDEAFQASRGYYQQEGDFDFHYRIVQGSGNRMLIRLLCDELLSARPHVPHSVLGHAKPSRSGLHRTSPNRRRHRRRRVGGDVDAPSHSYIPSQYRTTDPAGSLGNEHTIPKIPSGHRAGLFRRSCRHRGDRAGRL